MASRLVTTTLRWPTAQRVVSRPDAPIAALNELVDDPMELDVLVGIEGETNPLAREAAGVLTSIPSQRRYAGPLAGLVMLPFVVPRPSRFSEGTFGVLYAADEIETALREAAHHQAQRFAATSAPSGTSIPMYAFALDIDTKAVDARHGVAGIDEGIYDRESYTKSARFGRELREAGHDALLFSSVRHLGATCVGAFWPNVVRRTSQSGRWMMRWDGKTFDEFAKVL